MFPRTDDYDKAKIIDSGRNTETRRWDLMDNLICGGARGQAAEARSTAITTFSYVRVRPPYVIYRQYDVREKEANRTKKDNRRRPLTFDLL